MADTHVRVAPELADAAREAGGFAPGTPLPMVVRYSLAKAAGWPEAAARMAAGPGRDGKDSADE